MLIRAIEPIWGVEVMKANRAQDNLRRLTRGPAMLCQAMSVNRKDDYKDLTRDRDILIAETDQASSVKVRATPRIGISRAQRLRLRFVVSDSVFVSGPRKT